MRFDNCTEIFYLPQAVVAVAAAAAAAVDTDDCGEGIAANEVEIADYDCDAPGHRFFRVGRLPLYVVIAVVGKAVAVEDNARVHLYAPTVASKDSGCVAVLG